MPTGLSLVLVTSNLYETTMIGWDCSGHIPRLKSDVWGVGEKKEIESNSLGFVSKWLDTEVIWEPCRKYRLGMGMGMENII